MPANPAHSCLRDPITGLTSIEAHVVALYDGGATKRKDMAAKIGCAPETISDIIRRPHILQAIRDRALSEKMAPLIASREELMAFWTDVLRDEEEGLQQRMKASEYLGKAYAMFTDRVEQHTFMTFEDQLAALVPEEEDFSDL